MSNKAIKDFTETSTPVTTDALLMQRGNEYYWASHNNVMMGIGRKVLTLTQAQIKALSTPVVVVSAAGAGTVIDPLECTAFLDYNGTAYATAKCIRLKHSGNSNYIMGSSISFLVATADRYEKLVMQTISDTHQQMFANTDLVVDASATTTGGAANAINDGGTVTLDLLYVIKKFA